MIRVVLAAHVVVSVLIKPGNLPGLVFTLVLTYPDEEVIGALAASVVWIIPWWLVF
jgi:hypothetical protein